MKAPPVAATVRQEPPASLAGYRNRSEERVLPQRAVAIATFGWRLRVEPCPIGFLRERSFFRAIVGFNGQWPLPAMDPTYPLKRAIENWT